MSDPALVPTHTGNRNNRQAYLLDTLNLFFDPFATPVAEQELQDGAQEPRLFSYIVDLIDPIHNKPVSQHLLETRNGFVFGNPGSGKTTLKYVLESKYRNPQQNTLAVTYELSHDFESPPTEDEHWRALAENLAIDLFIQIIERIDSFQKISNIQKKTLTQQMLWVWHQLKRTVKRILNEDLSDTPNGVATLWTRHNRYPMRYIYHSTKINQLLLDCQPSSENTSLPEMSGLALLQQGIAAAKTWGFQHIAVFVDGVDAKQKDPLDMLAILNPLFESLEVWQRHALYFYFFLTNSLKPHIIQKSFKTLTHPPSRVNIEWNKNTLLNLLHQRLWAAGSYEDSFNAFAEPSLDLETLLYQASKGMPRRLLEITAALIDAHAEAHSSRFYITENDWLLMQEQWAQTHVAPLLPEGTSHVSPCNTLAPNYNSRNFENRNAESIAINTWLNANDSNDYIRIIAAPPKCGKTWFLAHMCKKLDRSKFEPIILPQLDYSSENELRQQLRSHPAIAASIDENLDISALLSTFVQNIQKNGRKVVIFFDYTLRHPGVYKNNDNTIHFIKKFLNIIDSLNGATKFIIATRNTKTMHHWRSRFKETYYFPLAHISDAPCSGTINDLGLDPVTTQLITKMALNDTESLKKQLNLSNPKYKNSIDILKTHGLIKTEYGTGNYILSDVGKNFV